MLLDPPTQTVIRRRFLKPTPHLEHSNPKQPQTLSPLPQAEVHSLRPFFCHPLGAGAQGLSGGGLGSLKASFKGAFKGSIKVQGCRVWGLELQGVEFGVGDLGFWVWGLPL